MSQLLRNIDSIIGAFDKYAKPGGDRATLSKAELRQLIQKEFAEVIVNPHDSQTIETVFQLLDGDGDGQVDFEEFTVLVFRVARACYKKEREDQAQAEGQLEVARGLQTQLQGKRTPSRGSPRRSTQQPQIPGNPPDCFSTGESQASSQEPQERTLEAGGPSPRHSQEPTCQTLERSSGSGPAQRQTGWGLSHQPASGAQRTGQGHTQQRSQEPQSQMERSSCRCAGEARTQEGDSAQEHQASQQSVAPEPSRPAQAQQQERPCRQECQPQTPKEQRPTQERETELSQRQALEAERGEEEVASPGPEGSQGTVQGSNCGRVQECQTSGQRGTRQPSQEDLPRETPLTCRDPCPTRQQEQNSQREEHLTQRQESEPLTREEGPNQEHRPLQQGTAQGSSQHSQEREQSLPCQQKPQAWERPTPQHTQETEERSRWRQTQEGQRGRQEVALSNGSQGTVQGRNCEQVREPQAPEQRGTRQHVQDSQVERSSPDLQQDQQLTRPEQCLSRQRSQTGERPTRQQEREPLMQGEGPTQERGSAQQSPTQQASRPPRQQEHEPQTPERSSAQAQNPQVLDQTPTCPEGREALTQEQGPGGQLEESSPEPEAVSSQRPTPAGQRPQQVSTGQFQCETQTDREHPIRQQEHPSPQGLEKDRARPWEQVTQSPQQAGAGCQEHECLASGQLPAAQQEQEPQAPTEGLPCHQERQPQQSRLSTGESKPQTTNRGQCREPTEAASAQGPRESSAQQGFKPSQRSRRPPQSTSSWTSRQ